MTQPFGSCDILSSASLALAALTANVATAPRQVASSNLRITKPPTLFRVLFVARWAHMVQRRRLIRTALPKVVTLSVLVSAVDSQERIGCPVNRSPLKPETTKCYARHP